MLLQLLLVDSFIESAIFQEVVNFLRKQKSLLLTFEQCLGPFLSKSDAYFIALVHFAQTKEKAVKIMFIMNLSMF